MSQEGGLQRILTLSSFHLAGACPPGLAEGRQGVNWRMREASGSIGYSCHYPWSRSSAVLLLRCLCTPGAEQMSHQGIPSPLSARSPCLLGLQIKLTGPGSALEGKKARLALRSFWPDANPGETKATARCGGRAVPGALGELKNEWHRPRGLWGPAGQSSEALAQRCGQDRDAKPLDRQPPEPGPGCTWPAGLWACSLLGRGIFIRLLKTRSLHSQTMGS